MKKRIEVIEVMEKEHQLILQAESVGEGAERLSATGQLLADSDKLSFIYILDNGEDFTYLSIASTYWPSLKRALDEQLEVIAQVDGKMIVLESFHEELQYLVENIKDNANYGEEMEQTVVDIFHHS